MQYIIKIIVLHVDENIVDPDQLSSDWVYTVWKEMAYFFSKSIAHNLLFYSLLTSVI